jgi:O-antigen ligase
MGIHLGASRGQSLGLEIFGLRLQSIVTPALEESSLSRMLLLPKIIAKIKGHPFIGDGLADTVTVYSPVVKKEITTSQFDWGFLEIWAELGLVGLLAWASLISFLVYQLKQQYFTPAWQLGSIVVLGVITLTSPALFHVLGIVWLTVLAATQPVRASQKSSS